MGGLIVTSHAVMATAMENNYNTRTTSFGKDDIYPMDTT